MLTLSLTGIEVAFQCMKQAYDCGINFFDTAERYLLRTDYGAPRADQAKLCRRRVGSCDGPSDQKIRLEAQRHRNQHEGEPINPVLGSVANRRTAQLGSCKRRDSHQQPWLIPQAHHRRYSGVVEAPSIGLCRYHIRPPSGPINPNGRDCTSIQLRD
jgi:hypothetical protein